MNYLCKLTPEYKRKKLRQIGVDTSTMTERHINEMYLREFGEGDDKIRQLVVQNKWSENNDS